MPVNDIKGTTHRFSDVAGEPCIKLVPLEGYNKKPLVSLEQAIEPLISLTPRNNIQAYLVKQPAPNPANDLTIDESAEITFYTMQWEAYLESVYYILNQTLGAADRQNLKPWFLYFKFL